MFDLSFKKENIIGSTFVSKRDINVKYLSCNIWSEHCLECAPPHCYKMCSNYLARCDKKCQRVDFRVDERYMSSSGYSVNCDFRKWSKLESRFPCLTLSTRGQKIINFIFNKILSPVFIFISYLLKPIFPTLKPLGAYIFFRNRIIEKLGKYTHFDYFYIECFSESKTDKRLFIQCDSNGEISFRTVLTLKKGENFFAIPFSNFNIKPNKNYRIFLNPEDDGNFNVSFNILNFVKLKKENINNHYAKYIKCVVWNLDNTLWKGILSEDGLQNIKLNKDAVDTIKELDRRGILNSISSKNDYDDAMNALSHFGLDEYFVSPAINWGQKSNNIREIAKNLNIGIDTFLFIDDSSFEREDVRKNLPMVRVISNLEIPTLMKNDFVDVEVSEFSKGRRLQYKTETIRNSIKAKFSNKYDDFLRELQLNLVVIAPKEKETIDRCYELIQRSNQLNLTTRRYSHSQFNQFITDCSNYKYAFQCFDKFGDYGIIAFARISTSKDVARLEDLVISCRVSQRCIEKAIIEYITSDLNSKGFSKLLIKLIKTGKNSTLVKAFENIKFDEIIEDLDSITYILSNFNNKNDSDIYKISVKD